MSVQEVAGGEPATTHATVAVPIVLPTVYVVPSTGTSATAVVALRSTTTVPLVVKSESAGLVHARATCALPAVAVDEVTAAGEVLSMVMVALPVSEPAVELVPVIAVTVAVVAYVAPGTAGMLA